jgi:hypothetical protein
MDYSAQIVALLLERPHWSNSAIARRVGCEQRRVRRYRRRLAECGERPDDIRELDPTATRALLNARQKKYTPDFARLREMLPHATGRALWRAYVASHSGSDPAPMSYSHFMRHLSESGLL